MVKITPEKYYYNSIIQLHVSWVKRYKNIQVELHKMSKGYLVLIGYNVFTEKSGDRIDRVEVVKTDRKYLLVIIKEPLGFRISKSGELKPDDTEPGIIKLESDIIVYLPLPEDAYKVDIYNHIYLLLIFKRRVKMGIHKIRWYGKYKDIDINRDYSII